MFDPSDDAAGALLLTFVTSDVRGGAASAAPLSLPSVAEAAAPRRVWMYQSTDAGSGDPSAKGATTRAGVAVVAAALEVETDEEAAGGPPSRASAQYGTPSLSSTGKGPAPNLNAATCFAFW